jgi:hypothetical protein
MNHDVTENFYEHAKVKKYLPKINDKQVKLTGMPLTQHVLLAGATGANKSNMLLNYIKRSSGTFTKILMLIKKVEPFNLLLKEILGDTIQFYFKLEDFPDVSQFPDLGGKNNKLYCIVFDDFITESNKKNLKKIDDYLIYGRSKGCTVIMLSQSYYSTSTLLRKQCSFICLCGIKGKRDLKSILNEYSMGDIDTDALKRMYDYAKTPTFKGEPTMLKIETGVCAINKKFSRNFLEYLNPHDFEKGKESKSDSDDSDSDDEKPTKRRK